MSGQTNENTTYIKGKRQRSERSYGTTEMIDILMCDLKRNVQIMPASKTYFVDLWAKDAAQTQTVADKSEVRNPQSEIKKGGVITMTYTTKDTGERKQMFGYTARHIITTMITESSPESCSPMKNKMVIDGWYIDAAFQLDCQAERYKNYKPTISNNRSCEDRIESKTIGTAKRGFPVWEKSTSYDESGKESHSMVQEVVEISNAVLDAALFDAPAGYTEAKSREELYASMSRAKSNQSAMNDDDEPVSSNSNNALRNVPQSTAKVAATVGAKKPGVARIGIATVKTGSVGDGMNAAQLAAAIGNSLAEYLKAPNVELVQIEAKLPSQIDAEAKQKECDFVVYTNVAHKKGGGGFGGMFGKAAGNILGSAIPMAGGTGAAIAGSVTASAIYTAASMSETVKSKDEITLDIRMTGNGSAVVLTKQFKAKAKSDGEDIISPLIEQAAQAIVDAAKQ